MIDTSKIPELLPTAARPQTDSPLATAVPTSGTPESELDAFFEDLLMDTRSLTLSATASALEPGSLATRRGTVPLARSASMPALGHSRPPLAPRPPRPSPTVGEPILSSEMPGHKRPRGSEAARSGRVRPMLEQSTGIQRLAFEQRCELASLRDKVRRLEEANAYYKR